MNIDYPRVLLGGLGLALVLALVVAASTSTAAFGLYNPGWEGAGELRAIAEEGDAEAIVVLNTSTYGSVEAEQTVALVLSPERGYEQGGVATLRRFVEAGGTLVVAEDFGPHGNALLEGVGATARFDGRLVRDEQNHGEAPTLPLATNVTETDLTRSPTAGVDQLTLNYGTVLQPGDATVLVGTSGVSYLDANRNERVDEGEPLRSYPVVAVESVGEGRVVAVSDPSLFINAMLDREGNRRFTANLFDRERVLLDYSHAGSQPPLTTALLTVRGSPRLQGGVLALTVALVVGLSWAVGRTGRETSSPEAPPDRTHIAQYLARERGWDVERLERVTTGVWGRGSDGEKDE